MAGFDHFQAFIIQLTKDLVPRVNKNSHHDDGSSYFGSCQSIRQATLPVFSLTCQREAFPHLLRLYQAVHRFTP